MKVSRVTAVVRVCTHIKPCLRRIIISSHAGGPVTPVLFVFFIFTTVKLVFTAPEKGARFMPI